MERSATFPPGRVDICQTQDTAEFSSNCSSASPGDEHVENQDQSAFGVILTTGSTHKHRVNTEIE